MADGEERDDVWLDETEIKTYGHQHQASINACVAECIMLEILTILIGLLDLATALSAARKYWRIACGLFVAASTMVVISFIGSSPAIRWIVGFHVFVLIVTVGIVWEQKRGTLKD